MQKGKSTLKTAHIAHSTPGLIHSPFRRGNRCLRNANTQSKVDNFRWITPGSWVKGTSWHFRGFQRAGLKSRSAASVKTAFYCAPGFSKSKKVSLIKDSWWPAVIVEPADGRLCELRCVCARDISAFWVLQSVLNVLVSAEVAFFKCFHGEIMIVKQNTALIKTDHEPKIAACRPRLTVLRPLTLVCGGRL